MARTRIRSIALLAAAAVLAACGNRDGGDSESPEAGAGEALGDSITVATSGNFAPFTMIDDAGEPDGYAVDVALEMGERMGVEIEFQAVDFAAVLQGVSTGRFDMSDGSVTVTEERRAEFDWTMPVASSGSVALIREEDEGEITGLDSSLKGRRMGAIDGSAQQQWTEANAEDLGYSELLGYPGASEAILDLQNGRIDAITYDVLNSLYYVQENPDSGVTPVGDIQNPSLIASGTAQGNDELLDAANVALMEMYEDGTLGSLQAEWFGEALPTPTDLDEEGPWPTAPTN